MRETRKLTEQSIKALEPRTKPYKAADGEGLYIEVTPAGGKLWRLKYRFGGKEKRLSFGPWPDIGVDAAREKATDARATLRAGTDPARWHRAARGGTNGETMGTLADTWAAKQAWAPSTENRERHLMALWTPALGDIPARALTPPEIRPVVLAIETEGHNEFARRALAQIGRVLRHAIALGHAERDVAADLGDVLAPVQSEKYATLTKPADIAELMKAIHTYTGDPSTVYCLRILPLVYTRPGERMKMRRKNPGEHLVPLSTQATALLRELRTITGHNSHGLLFPGLVAGTPISDATLGQALRRLGYGPDRIVPHGFRAVASSVLNEQGHLPDLIELQLAHRDASVRAVYNRSTRLPDRRALSESSEAGSHSCVACRYTIHYAMIKSFRHDGLARFFRTGSKAGIRPEHAKRLNVQWGRLDGATCPEDMNMPGWRFHRPLGELAGHYSVSVSGNWRLTFKFEGKDAVLVDYQDYH